MSTTVPAHPDPGGLTERLAKGHHMLTRLSTSLALIETRRLGISVRMLAAPVPARPIVLGEALGRVAVALGQGLFIIAATGLLFGVR